MCHPLTPDAGQVGKILGEKWKALNDTERLPYEAKAKADKERYDREKASYNVSILHHPPKFHVTNAPSGQR